MKLVILYFLALAQTKVVKNTHNLGALFEEVVEDVTYVMDEYCSAKTMDMMGCIVCVNSINNKTQGVCIPVAHQEPHCISYYNDGRCQFCQYGFTLKGNRCELTRVQNCWTESSNGGC